MAELLSRALSGDTNALQGLAALVAILSLVPAAATFVVAQLYNIGSIRRAKHERAISIYRDFLALSLEQPEVRVAFSREEPKIRTTSKDLYIRDTLFDYLTSVFEEAYLLYQSSWLSNRSRQWSGWLEYIKYYLSRRDYRDWWYSVSMESNPNAIGFSTQANLESQYDTRFQIFMNRLASEMGLESPKEVGRT